MAISGLTPTSALPGLMPGAPLAGSNPLLGAPSSGLPGGHPLLGAQAGVVEKPGIGSRLKNAMRAAIGELRGAPSALPTPMSTQLSMQSSAPVSVTSPVATPAGPVRTARKVKSAKSWKTLANPPKAAAASAAPAGATGPVQGSQLPANALQLPGATVYSYDQQGNPVAPSMQQLGITPTMLQGVTGAAAAVDQEGPQLNATNQTNVGAGMGMGMGIGTAVPVLGQPIATTPPAAAPLAAPTTPHNGAGANQSVTNNNATDVSSRNQGMLGGWGASPLDGIATPMAPYGSSMTGAYALGNGSRLF